MFLNVLKLTFFLLLWFIGPTHQSQAAPVCGGTFVCYKIRDYCEWSISHTTAGCDRSNVGEAIFPILGICTCNDFCTSEIDGPWQCGGGNTCPDSSPTSYLCSEMCQKPPNWYSCSLQQDECTGYNTGCSANKVCCAGTEGVRPNYCSNSCYDCAGNWICATPTPTPQPPGPPMGNTASPSCGTGTQVNVTYTWTPGTNAQNHYICAGAGSSYNPRADENSGNCAPVSSSPHTIVGYTQGNVINWDVKACNGSTCVFSANGYYSVTLPSNCGAAAPTATPPPGSTVTPTPTRTPTPPVGTTPTSTPVPTVAGCQSVGGTCTNFADCCGGSANPQTATCVSNRCQAVPTPTPGSGGGGGGTCNPPSNCGTAAVCYGDGVAVYNSCTCTYGPVTSCPFGCWDGDCLTGSISGYTFRDANGNGVQDFATFTERINRNSSIEPGIGSVTVNLTGPQNGTTSSRSSGSIGYYDFGLNLSGTYTVRVNTPSGYVNTSNQSVNVDLSSGSNSRTVGFGLLESTSTPIPTPTPTSGSAPTPTPTTSFPATCIGGLSTNTTTVPPGSTIKLTVNQCSGVNPIGNSPTPTPVGGIPTPTASAPTPTPCPWWFFCPNPTATPTSTPTPTPLGATPVPTYTPFRWNPNVTNATPPPSQGGQVDNPSTGIPTSSTIDWTAPSCPPSGSNFFTPGVTVEGPNGNVFYSTRLTVPGTLSLTGKVMIVPSAGSCTSSTVGSAYNNNGAGAGLTMLNTATNTSRSTITNPDTGTGVISCLTPGEYKLSVNGLPPGFNVVGYEVTPATETPTGPTEVQFSTGNNNQTATFCVTSAVSWFQTDQGNVRFSNLTNSVPSGKFGSSDANYPGIYYSSKSTSSFGSGTVSQKGWKVDREFDYNTTTENINGGLSYSFFKSKARQDGVTITNLPNPTLSMTDIEASPDYGSKNAAVYEMNGNLTINNYTHANGKRVVILVNGDVTISDNTIEVPKNGGLFIIAAKGRITFEKNVGVASESTGYSVSSTPRIDGFYSAEGDIILEGDKCNSGSNQDLRLNIGGALIAHSLKPFSTTGSGSIINNRSLCAQNGTYPVLFVSSRPDFLTQMTDFYKTSYTKWREVNP